MNSNLLLMTDSYKSSHYLQYPPKTTSMFSYLESRGGLYKKTVFFGLQYLLKEYLSKPILFHDVVKARDFFKAHGEPFNFDGWLAIVTELGGKLPVRIRAVPEGTLISTKNVLMTVESTDPRFFWLVGYLETFLERVWYPITVATVSFEAKKTILKFLNETSDDPVNEINFKLHDFGARGVSSGESAAIGGAAHLVNFMGSDTVEGVLLANEYYSHDMAAFSIPAAEHSTITSWGKEHEVDAYRNMLRNFAGSGNLLAVVSDSYNVSNAVDNIWGAEMRSEVIASGSKVVIRLDSGNPVEGVREAALSLAGTYGTTTNKKGFKVLNNVGLLWGDGISNPVITEILSMLKYEGFSASNIAFGMGGALLQKVNRDIQTFAYKCSSVTVEGKEQDVFKQPVGDPWKASKKGRLDLIMDEEGTLSTVRLITGAVEHADSVMETVYENGDIKKEYTLDEIRATINCYL